MTGIQLSIDLALPDEAVAIADLPDIGEQPDAAAVQAAAQAVAEVQRHQRVALLESRGLGLTQHQLSDSGPLSPALLGALRIAMLTGSELRSLPTDTDPCSGPLSATSECKTCDTLRHSKVTLSVTRSVTPFYWCNGLHLRKQGVTPSFWRKRGGRKQGVTPSFWWFGRECNAKQRY